jgi:hypothetical protein
MIEAGLRALFYLSRAQSMMPREALMVELFWLSLSPLKCLPSGRAVSMAVCAGRTFF